jgi:hypothetical protein
MINIRIIVLNFLLLTFTKPLFAISLKQLQASSPQELSKAFDLLRISLSKIPPSVFRMKKNKFYFFNNYLMLHNRSSFTGERKIWRVWLQEK